MTINGFDELNTPKVQVEEPEEYFKKMDISPKQRKERVETSKELADVMLFLFALLAIEMQANKPNYPSVLRSFRQRFREVVGKHSRIDDYVENYINELTGGVFDTTKRYMEAAGVGVNGRTDAGWWTSVDRATVIGENEANSILNYQELQQAADEGYTTKEWVTEKDNRVRPTHKEVDGVTIGIKEYFIVGGGMMLAPHDEYNNPEECPNCRCTLVYGGKGKSKKELEMEQSVDDGEVEVSTDVEWEKLTDKKLKERLAILGEDDKTTDTIVKTINDILVHRNRQKYEDLGFIYTSDGEVLVNTECEYFKNGVSGCWPTDEMMKKLNASPSRSVIAIHNHPRSFMPSPSDIMKAMERNYKYGLVVGHNGTIYKYAYTGQNPAKGVDIFSAGRRVAELSEIQYNYSERTEEDIFKELKELGVSWEILP